MGKEKLEEMADMALEEESTPMFAPDPSHTYFGSFISGGLIGAAILLSTALAVHKFAPEPTVIHQTEYVSLGDLASVYDTLKACEDDHKGWLDSYLLKTRNEKCIADGHICYNDDSANISGVELH